MLPFLLSRMRLRLNHSRELLVNRVTYLNELLFVLRSLVWAGVPAVRIARTESGELAEHERANLFRLENSELTDRARLTANSNS